MKKRTKIFHILLAAWLVLSFLAAASMYKLWWNRERVMYVGNSVLEQREQIFGYAGLPPASLHNAKVLDDKLDPEDVYQVSGSMVDASYAAYLLIPRLPSGGEGDPVLSTRKTSGTPLFTHGVLGLDFHTLKPHPFGFILSLLILSGMAMQLTRLGLSFPEGFACVSFFTMGVVVLSKGIFGTIHPAGILLTVPGLAAWIGYCCRCSDARKDGVPACLHPCGPGVVSAS